MLRLEKISNRWGKFELKDISLKIDRGKYFALLGPTGSGKTLLLETIAGIWRPMRGSIWLDGKELTSLPSEKRDIGFVYQENFLFPHLSVLENICYGLKLKRLSNEEIERRVGEIAETLKIEKIIERKNPISLSGGEKRKVALARALVLWPKLLLLDEPLSSIDYPSRGEIISLLKDINRNYRITIIHVTHDRTEARSVADMIGIINRGKLEEVEEAEKIFQTPKKEFTAKFLGLENIFKKFPLNSEKTIYIQPTKIIISHPKPSLPYTFKAEVKKIFCQNKQIRVVLSVDGLNITAICKDEGSFPKRNVWIGFGEDAIHFLGES